MKGIASSTSSHPYDIIAVEVALITIDLIPTGNELRSD
jgi:hypothetical protein